jgi:hypothetical protein
MTASDFEIWLDYQPPGLGLTTCMPFRADGVFRSRRCRTVFAPPPPSFNYVMHLLKTVDSQKSHVTGTTARPELTVKLGQTQQPSHGALKGLRN